MMFCLPEWGLFDFIARVEEFLEFVIKSLVDAPDEVVIVKREIDHKIIFTVQVNPGDVGKIIGKQGLTIEAIRSVLAAGAARHGLKATFELV